MRGLRTRAEGGQGPGRCRGTGGGEEPAPRQSLLEECAEIDGFTGHRIVLVQWIGQLSGVWQRSV